MSKAEPLGANFLTESRALDAFVQTLPQSALNEATHFYNWTVRDEIMHLLFLDQVTQLAIEDESGFLAQLAEIRAWQAQGRELSDYMRRRYEALGNDALMTAWRRGYEELATVFANSHPKNRMKWFGPDMSIVSATSARQMEVWAHGQDIYDHFHASRINGDIVRNICELGVRTFGWSFINRRLPVPAAPPRVELKAPSGAMWAWNPEGEGTLSGPAEDFALVVTQRRNVADTDLVCEGTAALDWMRIAQCFAGAPSDGPEPGLREMFGRGYRNAD